MYMIQTQQRILHINWSSYPKLVKDCDPFGPVGLMHQLTV